MFRLVAARDRSPALRRRACGSGFVAAIRFNRDGGCHRRNDWLKTKKR
jgi:hypothetical protein